MLNEDEMKIIASQFIRSLMRGETPSGPQGPLPKSVRWLPAQFDWHGNDIANYQGTGKPHPSANWADPEWTKKFQEAYRQTNPSGIPEAQWGRNLPGWTPQVEAGFNEFMGHTGRDYGARYPQDFERPQQIDEGWRVLPPDRMTHGDRFGIPFPDPGTQDPGLKVPYPKYHEFGGLDLPLQGVGRDWLQSGKDYVQELGRINPVELAKNLGSRVNAGPVGPWDLFPGGIDGYLNYLARNNAALGPFFGGGGDTSDGGDDSDSGIWM